mmetsp:Transcript_600/g.1387  ORF Transcript_600/g.1387 Transcript_600/m.1387 type:complete len:282 (+) Transcript_600:564-1409(+)
MKVSAVGGNLAFLEGRLDLGTAAPFGTSEELGLHVVGIGLGGFDRVYQTLVAHAVAVFIVLAVGGGAVVLDVEVELDGNRVADGLDDGRKTLSIVEEVGDLFGGGRTLNRHLHVNMLEARSDTRIKTEEPFEVDDTGRIDDDLGDGNPLDRAMIRQRDGEAMGHRVKERICRALIQPLAQQSNGFVASPTMGDSAVRVDAVLLVAGEGRLDDGTLLPLRRAAELEGTKGRIVGHSLDGFGERLDVNAVHVRGFIDGDISIRADGSVDILVNLSHVDRCWYM